MDLDKMIDVRRYNAMQTEDLDDQSIMKEIYRAIDTESMSLTVSNLKYKTNKIKYLRAWIIRTIRKIDHRMLRFKLYVEIRTVIKKIYLKVKG